MNVKFITLIYNWIILYDMIKMITIVKFNEVQWRHVDIIGLDNGLALTMCQAIAWTKTSMLSVGPLKTYFHEIHLIIQLEFLDAWL